MAETILPNTAICPDCGAPFNSKGHHWECEGVTPEECEPVDAMKRWKSSIQLDDGSVLDYYASNDCESVN